MPQFIKRIKGDQFIWSLVSGLILVNTMGCQLGKVGSISVCEVPQHLRADGRDAMVPVNLSALSQVPPLAHRIGPGDILGVYVKGVLDLVESPRPIEYPPNVVDSNLRAPATGFPVEVDHSGKIHLPLIPPMDVNGLTIPEAMKLIEDEYVRRRDIVQEESSRVTVSLIRPRVVRVTVIREDSPVANPSLRQEADYELIAKRGTALTIELPIYENDVLHALSASGGLPGQDALSEIVVFRSGVSTGFEHQAVPTLPSMDDQSNATPPVGVQHVSHTEVAPVNGLSDDTIWQTAPSYAEIPGMGPYCRGDVARIPLRTYPSDLPPFTPDDVILQSGDVVLVPARDTDFFYTGGLLRGAKIPLPRDHDLDVLSAIAMAHGFVSGPDKLAGASNFRGPGNIVPPTQILVVRKTPDGNQVKILVDMKTAMMDASERLIVAPGDLVLLQYTPLELLSNVALNIVGLNYSIPND